MDIVSFNAMYESLRRNEARGLMQTTMLDAITAHAPERLKDQWKVWQRMEQRTEQASDEDAFLKRVGRGF